MRKSRKSNKEKTTLSECIYKTCSNLYFDERESYWGKCSAMLLEMLIGYALLNGKTESIPDIVLGNLNSEGFNENLQGILNFAQEYQPGNDNQLQNISMMMKFGAEVFLPMASGVQAWQLKKIREVSIKAICNSRNTEAINSLLKTITECTTAPDATLGTNPSDAEATE